MRRVACVSVDLDPVGCYLSQRGLRPVPATNLNAVYEDGLPRFLEIFKRLSIRATFFVVAQDALNPANARLLRQAVADGHELANHSFAHRLDLADADPAVMREDFAQAESALEEATGVRPRGFRAPGWNVSHQLFACLSEREYRYDSSLVPFPLGRLVGRLLPQLQRVVPRFTPTAIFQGQIRWPAPPSLPYPVHRRQPWTAAMVPSENCGLWEVPHGALRFPPVPLNGTVSALLGDRIAPLTEHLAGYCRSPVVFVFHGIDLVRYEAQIRDPRLRSKPGLTEPLSRKIRRVERVLRNLGRGRRWMRLADLVDRARRSGPMKTPGC